MIKKPAKKDFNKKHKKLLGHNKEAFEKSKQKFLAKAKDDFIKANLEGHNGFDINSELGRDYIAVCFVLWILRLKIAGL